MTKLIKNSDVAKVAVIGAGFGGMEVVKGLAGKPNYEVTLIDKKNHHLFQPLLYQVAVAGLSPSNISVPIRKYFGKYENVEVIFSLVEDINAKKLSVLCDGEWKNFDYVVLACGSAGNYFGNSKWERFAPNLKSLDQAIEIRHKLISAFEIAEKTKDKKLLNSLLTFVVIGGGPTGVEMAGAIAELAKKTLKSDYKHINFEQINVYLLESSDNILNTYPEKLSDAAANHLENMGVQVLTESKVKDIDSFGVDLGDRVIESKTIVWAAGVRPSKLCEKINTIKDDSGRIIVNKDLSIKSSKNFFAIGDIAHFKDENDRPLPGLAPVAIQQGKFVSDQIVGDLQKKNRKTFKYFDKGTMATIGRSKAVLKSGPIQMKGFGAWVIWMFVHVLYLTRFKNKFFVLVQWIWSYFRFGNGARLITKNYR